MGKHTDKLGSFENFTAPWETEAGSDAEIDKPKLKRLIFNLKSGEAKALDAQADAVESVKTIEAELEEAKKEAASSNGEEATKKIAKLEKELAEAKTKAETLEKDKEISDLRAEVLEGVDPKHAKHVKGETREELEASLKEIREDFGITEPSGDDDDDEDEPTVRNRPRTKLTNPADTKTGADSGEIDFDKIADQILGNSVFG